MKSKHLKLKVQTINSQLQKSALAVSLTSKIRGRSTLRYLKSSYYMIHGLVAQSRLSGLEMFQRVASWYP